MFKLGASARYLLVFVGIFIMTKILATFTVQQILMIFFPIEQIPALLGQQEAVFQSLALAAGLFCSSVYESNLKSVKVAIIKFFKSPWGNEELMSKIMSSSFYGFLFACCVIAVSIFFGFVKIEAPSMASAQFLRIIPTLILQSLFFLIWIVILERTRQLLIPLLFQSIATGWSLIIYCGFESQLLYSFYESITPPAAFSPIKIIFCIFLSLALNLSYLHHLKFYPHRRYKSAVRTSFLCGLWFSFIHIFGQNIAEWRAASLMQILQGPLQMNQAYLYLALLILLTNTMLQGLLKEKVIQT